MRKAIMTVIAVAGLCAATAAIADNTVLKTSRGKPVSTGPYLSWTGGCKAGFLEIVVETRPSHGELTIEPEDGVIDSVVTGAFGKCKGKTIPGKAIKYYPDSDFVGVDRFAINVTYETKQTFKDTYEVEVSR